jgi:DNA-binding LacI/PurR family transcriptional regulator
VTPAARPTLDTVAAAAAVSRMTVSNTYNRPQQVASATRERVLAAAARLGYAGPDPTAASLRLRRTGTVGVLLTESLPYAFTDPGMVQLLHGMAAALADAGSALLLVPGSGGADGAALVRQVMVDALILCSLDADDAAVRAARERQIPLVTVGSPRLAGAPLVGVDNHDTAALGAAYLQRLGHRRFAVLTAGPPPGSRRARPGFAARPAGFVGALTGVAAEDVPVCTAMENSRAAGAEAVRDLLKLRPGLRPTALFAVTDILALGVLDAARAGGVRVPEQLSVLGYDDIPEATTNVPALSTIRQDLFGQGRTAARLAVRRAAGERVRAPRIHAELVVRASTAAPGR